MEKLEYLKERKAELKQVIYDYYNNFIDDNGVFDEESYMDSAMEGELVETVNGELLDEEMAIMCGDDKCYDFIDKVADEVLKNPKFEEILEHNNENYS